MNLGLTASDICKSYNGNQVLKDCSFSFDKGGIYVLTGPNGCGKSTFLRICSLIEPPDSGRIIYSSGDAVRNDLELKRRITVVLPRVGVFNTTVFGNVAYGLTIRGIRGDAAKDRINKALEFVGLSHKKDQNALTLSSGETRRMGIARALVIEPEILFLDEPTASVDEKNTGIIEVMIRSMREKCRPSVIMTTHDIGQAKRLADIILVIREGRILAQGDAGQ